MSETNASLLSTFREYPSATRVLRFLKGHLVTLRLRRLGAQCDRRVIVEGPTPDFWIGGSAHFGHKVMFRTQAIRGAVTVRPNAYLSIGESCFINGGVQIDAWESISIGPHCHIGNNVRIADTPYHEVDEGAGPKVAPIIIGRNVWLAGNVTILPGTVIGDHSVVGAGSIVKGSFPDRSLIAGIPGRKIRDIVASDDYIRP